MEKDFDRWNEAKKTIHYRTDTENVYFKQRDIWWVHLGINVGFEQDGTGEVFERPVVIIKKYNARVFLAVPLSTTEKTGKYYFEVGTVADVEAKAIISQLRLLDRNRLINHTGRLNEETFKELVQQIVEVNFSIVPPRSLRKRG